MTDFGPGFARFLASEQFQNFLSHTFRRHEYSLEVALVMRNNRGVYAARAYRVD